MGFDSFAAIDNPSLQVCHCTLPFHSTPCAGVGAAGDGVGSDAGATAARASADAAAACASVATLVWDEGGALPDWQATAHVSAPTKTNRRADVTAND